jgi:hypothetical protein
MEVGGNAVRVLSLVNDPEQGAEEERRRMADLI